MKGRFTAPARIALLTVFSVAFLFVFVFPTGSYLAQRRQVTKASHDLAVLRRQNYALSSEAEKLKTDPEVERIARERYNMALPGERLFQIFPTPTPTTTTAKPAAAQSSLPAAP